jgi:phage terminase small subunit
MWVNHVKLTALQMRFADEYLVDLVATAAYARAGYKVKGHGAEVNASRLLQKPHIQEYIQQRMKDRERRTEITQDRVLQELAKIGFANITDYLIVDGQDYKAGTDEAGEPITRRGKFVDIFETRNIDRAKLDAVSEIRQTKEGISIKLHDKVAALDKIGKHLGMFIENVNHKHKHSGTVTSEVVITITEDDDNET